MKRRPLLSALVPLSAGCTKLIPSAENRQNAEGKEDNGQQTTDDPPFPHHLEIRNRHPYSVTVEVVLEDIDGEVLESETVYLESQAKEDYTYDLPGDDAYRVTVQVIDGGSARGSISDDDRAVTVASIESPTKIDVSVIAS